MSFSVAICFVTWLEICIAEWQGFLSFSLMLMLGSTAIPSARKGSMATFGTSIDDEVCVELWPWNVERKFIVSGLQAVWTSR